MTIDLQKVSLGALAAERDKDLEQYFVRSESFRRLSSGERWIVLGNRGAGKSAIFRIIAAQMKKAGATVLQMAPEDYSYELFRDALAAEKSGSWAKQGAYAAAWKYLIYVSLMKAVTATGKSFKAGPAARVYNYVRDKHSGDFNPIGLLISYLKRLEGVKLGKHDFGIKARELEKLYKLEELSSLIDDLNEVCGARNAVVLVDELDKGWDASEDAVAFVAGLFQAAISINTKNPNIRVLISLRKELYDNIPSIYEDAQKVRDLIEVLEWDEPSLFDLISKRVHVSLEPQVAASVSDHWRMLFADILDYRQTKCFNYLIDRTLYRPREVIQFCTDAISAASKRGDTPPLNYAAISQAELAYSEERLKDIAGEYRFQYPGLLSVFETFRGHAYNISRDELELHCLQVSTNDIIVDAEARKWCLDIDPLRLIDILWKVGFLRAQAVGGLRARRRSGSEYLGSHQISNLNLMTVTRFHVHPMFRAFLGLKESKGDAV